MWRYCMQGSDGSGNGTTALSAAVAIRVSVGDPWVTHVPLEMPIQDPSKIQMLYVIRSGAWTGVVSKDWDEADGSADAEEVVGAGPVCGLCSYLDLDCRVLCG